ncbi:hypothetical protein PoB_000656000 [Plakobranchus ocellatus]|uniref:Uncharacterized protein n=1 Tax=Plakobranchus ocellatus TaxID=259542 RepID=A0AAV3YBC2_9GAST|nr:hypothetical protein PoB_000656000 [Plakobranchus ocellatus]
MPRTNVMTSTKYPPVFLSDPIRTGWGNGEGARRSRCNQTARFSIISCLYYQNSTKASLLSSFQLNYSFKPAPCLKPQLSPCERLSVLYWQNPGTKIVHPQAHNFAGKGVRNPWNGVPRSGHALDIEDPDSKTPLGSQGLTADLVGKRPE